MISEALAPRSFGLIGRLFNNWVVLIELDLNQYLIPRVVQRESVL